MVLKGAEVVMYKALEEIEHKYGVDLADTSRMGEIIDKALKARMMTIVRYNYGCDGEFDSIQIGEHIPQGEWVLEYTPAD